MTDVEPVRRFEWERIMRRLVVPPPVKLLAFILASYADGNGTRIRPGNEILANVTGTSVRTVERNLSTLKRHGLIGVVKRGGGRSNAGRPTEYRLTIPVDLLDRLVLLEPGDRAPESPATHMAGQSVDGTHQRNGHKVTNQVVDNSKRPATVMAGQTGPAEPIDPPLVTPERGLTRHLRPIDPPQLWRTTRTRPPTKETRTSLVASTGDPQHARDPTEQPPENDHPPPMQGRTA